MKRRKVYIATTVFLVAMSVLGFALYRSVTGTQPSKEHADVVTYSTDTPDEVKPGSDYEWHGSPGDPRKIRIPSITVDGFVQNVGVDQNNEVAVPNNIHMAGWFVDTVRPGEKGLSVIDGHVDGPTVDDGIFRKLDTLKKGDEVRIEMGSGGGFQYEVFSVVAVPTAQAVNVLFSQDPFVASQLNLITCGGSWNADTKEYDQRIVVSAKLKNP